MKKLRVGISLVLALSLLVSTLAPTTALALGGKPIKPIENDDPPTPQVEETGDPNPDPGGLTIDLDSYNAWRDAFITVLRSQFAYLLTVGHSNAPRDRAARLSSRLGGRK